MKEEELGAISHKRRRIDFTREVQVKEEEAK
jgi:hypothetical protein